MNLVSPFCCLSTGALLPYRKIDAVFDELDDTTADAVRKRVLRSTVRHQDDVGALLPWKQNIDKVGQPTTKLKRQPGEKAVAPFEMLRDNPSRH